MNNNRFRISSIHVLVFILLFTFTFFAYTNPLVLASNGTNDQNEEKKFTFFGIEIDPEGPIITIIEIMIYGGIGYALAEFAIYRYQSKKDESEIRREVLRDFQASFKDYVVLMDTFVARLVFSHHSFDETTKVELSDYLPYGFRDFEERQEDVRMVYGKFSFQVQDEEKLKAIQNEFTEFEKSFFAKRLEVTRFLSGLRLYYKNGEELNNKFDLMWTRIMANHLLILKLIKSNEQKEFLELLHKYNKSAAILFEQMRYYDYELAKAKVKVGRRKDIDLKKVQ